MHKIAAKKNSRRETLLAVGYDVWQWDGVLVWEGWEGWEA